MDPLRVGAVQQHDRRRGSVDNGESFQRIGPGPVLSYTADEPFVIGSPKIRRFDDKWYLHYIAGQQWLDTGGRPEPVYVIRGATSDDGIEWHRFGKDLLPKRIGELECQASPDILWFEGRYHMFFSYRHAVGFKSKEKGYRIGYAVSDDLMEWSRDDARCRHRRVRRRLGLADGQLRGTSSSSMTTST